MEAQRWLLYWFLFLDVLSFLAGLIATILVVRGDVCESAHRGWSMLALILGITEMVGTSIFGIFMTCFVMLFEVFGGG